MHELAELDQVIAGWAVPASLGVTAAVPPIPLGVPSSPSAPSWSAPSSSSSAPSAGALAIVALLGLGLGLLIGRRPRGGGRA